ncbi:MAG TPA: hypothetical protein VHO06_09230 [Polyangia bacterium]|nr:hypothetical protein [Polyangia bacterium]
MTGGRLLLAISLLAPLACSSASNNSYLPPTGGGTGTGGSGPHGKVTVVITAPADQTTVNQNTTLTVTATIDDDGSDFIDNTSVTATLTSGSSTVAVGQLTTSGSDSYAGMLSIGALPAGSYTLTVAAASSGGATGQQSVSLTITAGPTLIVNSPVEGKSYNGSVTIEILVGQGAMPPVATLAGAKLTQLTLDQAASTTATDDYRETIFFGPAAAAPAGTEAFQVSGVQLLDVTDSDGNTTSEVKRAFVIDQTGPTFAATTPPPGALVGGVVTVSASVADDSGVLASSVVAVIGDAAGNPLFTLQLQPDLAGGYSALFDTANLTACNSDPGSLCIVFPTVSFRATDTVGNESSLGYAFSVDNVAPIADLDPPQMRQMRLGTNGYECSFAFDPLGVDQFVGDMPNDRCAVPQVFDLRARIEDDGNHATGLKVVPIAGIDPDATSVYVLDVPDASSNQPLVVDSDGDGNCDAINPLLVPTVGPLTQSDQVLKVRLAGVPPGGGADFRPDSSLPASAPCGQGTATAPPKVLCGAAGFEQPTVAIAYANDLPAIWSVEPIDADLCFGDQFDTLANNIPQNQWLCIAVATTDLAGNKSVSAPIRVYVQYQENGGFCAAPPASAGPPPTCTGTFDPAANTAATGSCQTRQFGAGEYYCAPGGC